MPVDLPALATGAGAIVGIAAAAALVWRAARRSVHVEDNVDAVPGLRDSITQINELLAEIKRGVAGMDKRFDGIGVRFDTIERRLDQQDQHRHDLRNTLQDWVSRLSYVEGKLGIEPRRKRTEEDMGPP